MPPTIRVLRPGDTTKPNPFTIFIIANPALEAPWNSGTFVVDPIMANQLAFDACANYIVTSLFGGLAGQMERLLGEPTIAPRVRVVSLFIPGLPPQDQVSLVAQDGVSDMLIARRNVFIPFLKSGGFFADVAYAVSMSATHTRASAWYTTDDDTRPGVPFILDGVNFFHRHFCLIPGTVALPASSTSMTAVHEFGHALSSYSNGPLNDLYVDNPPALNNKRGRPIPPTFSTYNGVPVPSDPVRDSLGYGTWQSYHPGLISPQFPALMDNYWKSPDHIPEHCQHDIITRQFLTDRLHAKISR